MVCALTARGSGCARAPAAVRLRGVHVAPVWLPCLRIQREACALAALRARRAAASGAAAAPETASSRVPEPAYVPAQEAGYDWTRRERTLLPLPAPPAGVADDPRIHNPLERLERLGTGWMGAVFEWEGVVVEERGGAHREAWLALAAELGKSPPPAFLLRRAAGMKSSQVVSEVLCWAREPGAVRKLAARKDELLEASLAGQPLVEQPGVRAFLTLLQSSGIPCALSTASSMASVCRGLESLSLHPFFAAVISGEDVQRGRPDPESCLYAAQALQRPPARCVLFGCANASVEAARDASMRCVAVAGPHAATYELGAADLVVMRLDELSVVNLKALFAREEEEQARERDMRGRMLEDVEDVEDVEDEEEEGDSDDEDPDDDMFGSRLF